MRGICEMVHGHRVNLVSLQALWDNCWRFPYRIREEVGTTYVS